MLSSKGRRTKSAPNKQGNYVVCWETVNAMQYRKCCISKEIKSARCKDTYKGSLTFSIAFLLHIDIFEKVTCEQRIEGSEQTHHVVIELSWEREHLMQNWKSSWKSHVASVARWA